MPAQSIHQHRALAYQSLPTSVQQHSGLLFSRLGRHEAHCRPHNRLADRFRIRSVVLVPLDVVASWRDAETAKAWTPTKPDAAASLRHRHVRVIRDYGDV